MWAQGISVHPPSHWLYIIFQSRSNPLTKGPCVWTGCSDTYWFCLPQNWMPLISLLRPRPHHAHLTCAVWTSATSLPHALPDLSLSWCLSPLLPPLPQLLLAQGIVLLVWDNLSVWALQLSLGLTSAVTRGVSPARAGISMLCSPWHCRWAGTETAFLASWLPTLRAEVQEQGRNKAR